MLKQDVLNDFHFLSDYLKKQGKIKNLSRYKEAFSAFLLHADHIKAYDFAAPFCKNKKVLDVGCFMGYGEKILADYAEEIVAIDGDDEALEFARRNNISSNVNFEKANATQLSFSGGTFDVVIAFQLIEHIPLKEVDNFLREVKRVLKTGGSLFITTPNRKFRLLPFQRPFNPEHYQEFTAKELFKTLGNVFDEVQLKGVRAEDWIEQIERKRVGKSPYRVYIRTPLLRFMNIILPVKIKDLLKKIKSQIIFESEEREISDSNYQFNSLFQKFSMQDFYLENQASDKSMDLFAICKKVTSY